MTLPDVGSTSRFEIEIEVEIEIEFEIEFENTPIAQLAEATGLSPVQCRFESDWVYYKIRRVYQPSIFPFSLQVFIVSLFQFIC